MLFTDTDSLTDEIKSKMIMNFLSTNICLTLVTIHKIQSLFDSINKKVIGKMKDKKEGKIIDEFVGLKSKIHSMKNIDGKESSMANEVNIATEFNEFKDTLFSKKIIRHKMKRIHNKSIKLEHIKSTKYYHVLMIKDLFWMMGFIPLVIFIKT